MSSRPVRLASLAGSAFLALLLASVPSRPAAAHCEVPCGIFADQMRFEAMLEDKATMEKAMVQIVELSAKEDPLSRNQLVRWVTTKDDHANKTMDAIAHYFMAQRIKPGTDEATNAKYLQTLARAHDVMRAAMKCKQSVDKADAAALEAAIIAFHKAYEAK